MRDATPPFAFSQFVPGFDFLKSLAGAATGASGSGSVPGLPSLSSWVAPTLSVEEVDKRIQELKTVQYWLEQNGHALKATIQALEVQKMTLSTLRGMNVRMEDLANAFTRHTPAASAPNAPAAPAAAAPAPSAPPATPMADFFGRMAGTAQPSEKTEKSAAPALPASADAGSDKAAAEDRASKQNDSTADSDVGKAGVIDPVTWWGAITQQFQQIAETAMRDAAQIQMPQMPKMPVVASPSRGSTTKKAGAGAASSSPSPSSSRSSKKASPATERSGSAQASGKTGGTGTARNGGGGSGKSAPRKTAAAARRPRG